MTRTYIALLSRSILGTVAASIRPKGGKPYPLELTPKHVEDYLGITKRHTRLTELSWTDALALNVNGNDILKVTPQQKYGRVYVTFRCDDGRTTGPSLTARLADARARTKADGGRVIGNLKTLCEYWGADTPRSLNRRVYKDTDCGASLSLYLKDGTILHNGDRRLEKLPITTPVRGFTVQTIIEGSDAEVSSDLFVLPVASVVIDEWRTDMESEAEGLWQDANHQAI